MTQAFVCTIDETLGFGQPGRIAMDENKGTATAPADDTFKVALHAKIISIASQPIAPRMLLELEHSARLARQFLMVTADPKALRRMRFGTEFSSEDAGVASEITGGIGEEAVPQQALYQSQGTFASAPKSETFGVTMIREFIAAMADFNKPKVSEPTAGKLSAGDLAYGITIAKESGMVDVQKKLERKLALLLGDMTEDDPPKVIDSPVQATEQGAAA